MLTIENAKNPIYMNEEGSFINLIVKFKEFDNELPFGASPNDSEEHGRILFARAKAGEFGEIATYIAQMKPEIKMLMPE